MATAYARWILATQSRSTLKMQRFEPSIGRGEGKAMATAYARWILSTQSRSTLKMQRFEPSIDLDFENGFFQKGYQLNNYFFGTFLPSSMRSRDTVKMQGFELAATLVPPSDFQNFFWGPRRAPRDPPGRGKRSVFAPSLCARVAEQDPCIFTRDYASPRPPTL